jgi:hypothetical protein
MLGLRVDFFLFEIDLLRGFVGRMVNIHQRPRCEIFDRRDELPYGLKISKENFAVWQANGASVR